MILGVPILKHFRVVASFNSSFDTYQSQWFVGTFQIQQFVPLLLRLNGNLLNHVPAMSVAKHANFKFKKYRRLKVDKVRYCFHPKLLQGFPRLQFPFSGPSKVRGKGPE